MHAQKSCNTYEYNTNFARHVRGGLHNNSPSSTCRKVLTMHYRTPYTHSRYREKGPREKITRPKYCMPTNLHCTCLRAFLCGRCRRPVGLLLEKFLPSSQDFDVPKQGTQRKLSFLAFRFVIIGGTIVKKVDGPFDVERHHTECEDGVDKYIVFYLFTLRFCYGKCDFVVFGLLLIRKYLYNLSLIIFK